jgi:hypothetical protein
MVQQKMLRFMRLKETRYTATVTGSKQINGDNLNNIICEASSHFRNKKRGYLKDETNELAMNIKNKNIRDLSRSKNEFKRGYQPRSNIHVVKDENGDLLADPYNILNRWKNYFS